MTAPSRAVCMLIPPVPCHCQARSGCEDAVAPSDETPEQCLLRLPVLLVPQVQPSGVFLSLKLPSLTYVSSQRTGVSMRYRDVRMAAFCQIFRNCDHWTCGSMQTTCVCTGSPTPKCAANAASVYCQNLFSEREAPRRKPSS